VRKLFLLLLAFMPLTVALACSSDDSKSGSGVPSAVGTTVAGVLTPASTQLAGIQTQVSGAAGTVQAGAGTAVTGAATQVGGAASTAQAGAGTAVTGAATQVTGAASTAQAGAGTTVAGAATQVTGAATARAGAGISLPITNADAARDAILEASKTGDWSKTGNPQDLANYPAWQQLANALKLAGAAVVADPGTVSVYRNPVDSSQPPSATNPNLIAFAVDDSSGKCAAGAIKGYPNFSTYQTVQIAGKPCTAQSVADAVKAGATGTPTP
jgi:hypothetical protein